MTETETSSNQQAEAMSDEQLLAAARERHREQSERLNSSASFPSEPRLSSRIPGKCLTCENPTTLERFICPDCDARATVSQISESRRKRTVRLRARGIPLEYARGRETLETYRPTTARQMLALEYALAWSQRKLVPLLVLTGPVGTGKTHLAASALVRALDHIDAQDSFATAHFVVFDDLIRHLQASFKPQFMSSEDELLGQYVDSDYLVVDDIGVKAPTSYTTGILFALINGRYESRRPTIIISNKSIGQLGAAIATPEETIQAERILSRLVDREWSIGIAVDGPDHRRSNLDTKGRTPNV